MWIPYNCGPNQIHIDREKKMKYSVTYLEEENEAVVFTNNIIGNYYLESFLGSFNAQESSFEIDYVTSQAEDFSQTDSSRCVNILDKPVIKSLFWTLYFDGSRSNDGARVECILINLVGEKTMIACRLEFECTNSIVEYEALVQGLYKEISLNVKYL